MLVNSDQKKKEIVSYKRDNNGHLMCHLCEFRPKATPAHPNGNPSTLHYHIKKQHLGDCAYVCKTCGHDFLHKNALETHMASRHPEQNQKVKMFKCDCEGCEFESLTRGNLEIHKARKHYDTVVARHLQMVNHNDTKVYHCTCCQKDFNSIGSYSYHIVKQINSHQVPVITA